MGGEVVHHIVEWFGFRESLHLGPEHRQEGIGFVVSPALDIYLAIGVVEEGEYIQGSVTDILELFKPFAHPIGLQIRCQPLEDLDALALVKEDQVRGRVAVEAEEVFHLGKEVRIADVKEVAGLVRLQPVGLQDTVQGGLTGCRTDLSTARLQTTLGPSQCPSSAARQRLGLAVKRHDA